MTAAGGGLAGRRLRGNMINWIRGALLAAVATYWAGRAARHFSKGRRYTALAKEHRRRGNDAIDRSIRIEAVNSCTPTSIPRSSRSAS